MDQNLIPTDHPSPLQRRGSHLPLDPSHNSNGSIDSLYSSLYSYSLSISESTSNADSFTVVKIQNINKELVEMLTSRVTAFLYFTENNHLSPQEHIENSSQSLVELKNSVETSLVKLDKDHESFVLVSKVLKNLSELQKYYDEEKNRLRSHQDEMKTLETEENELNLKLQQIENKMAKLVLEQSSVKSSCQCRVF